MDEDTRRKVSPVPSDPGAGSADEESIRRFLGRVPTWIAIGALLNLALVQITGGGESLGSLARVAPLPLFAAVVLAFVPWITRTLRMILWTRALGHPLGPRFSLRVVLSSDVLAAVTPTAVGGAPAKATFLYREGFNPGASLLLTALGTLEDGIFFALGIPVAVYLSPGIDMRGFGDALLTPIRAWFEDWILVGGSLSGPGSDAVWLRLGLWLLVAAGLLALLVWGLRALLAWGRGRFGPFGEGVGEQFRMAARVLWKQRRWAIVTLPLTAAQWSARYAVVSFVALGLGIEVDPFLLFVFQCVVFSIMTVFPLPGATGGAEGAFLLFHRAVAGADVAVLMGGWRVLTFLLPVSLAALLLLRLERQDERNRRDQALASRRPPE